MEEILTRMLRRCWHYVHHLLLLDHLAGAEERDEGWRDWAVPHQAPGSLAKRNRPGATLGEAVTLLAASAAIYLLIAVLIGILTRSP